jgi:hypothetical protein
MVLTLGVIIEILVLYDSKTIILLMLNDTEILVLQTIRMRLKGKEALSYLKVNGKDITLQHYYKIKGQLDATKLKRLHEIGQYGFEDQHLERIDNLELVQELLWKNYWKVHLNKPDTALRILREIREIQPYLSAYYEATKHVIEKEYDEGHINISSLGTVSTR